MKKFLSQEFMRFTVHKINLLNSLQKSISWIHERETLWNLQTFLQYYERNVNKDNEFWCLKSSEHDNLELKRENFEHKIEFCSFFYLFKHKDIRYKTTQFVVLSLTFIPKKYYFVSSLWFLFTCAFKCASYSPWDLFRCVFKCTLTKKAFWQKLHP